MNNKRQIEKLRDNVELSWAAYGYFDLIGKRFNKKILKDIDRESTPIITQADILDITYNKHIAVELNPHKQDDEIKIGTLKGDFTPTQAKRFSERYELIHHIPNTESGFSVTLFYNHTTKTYTLAFRGTEMTSIDGFTTDVLLTDGCITLLGFALPQYLSLLKLKEAIKQAIQKDMKQGRECEDSRLIVTGHSLGGHLAQALCLFHHKEVKELYTYNAPGFLGVVMLPFILLYRLLALFIKAIARLTRWIARLLNPNGFVGKIVQKSCDDMNRQLVENGEQPISKEQIVNEAERYKDYEDLENAGTYLKQAKKGETWGIEIHHCESIWGVKSDSILGDINAFSEANASFIAQLGCKFGAPSNIYLDYKNTQKFHLINIKSYSHSIKPLAQCLHFFSYLMFCKDNESKYESYDIATALDNLNEFIECLQRLAPIAKTLNKKTENKTSPIAIILDNAWYLCRKIESLHNEQDAKEQNFIIDSSNMIEGIYKLYNKGYKIKLFDKADIEQIDIAQCTIAQKRALCQLEPFIFIDDSNNECLSANNYAKIYRHNSSSTQIVSAKENDTYWNIRKRDMIGFHFDKNVAVIPLGHTY